MYIVEGNTGVGKSTFCKEINRRAPEIEIALEPIGNWTNQEYGASLLANFYEETPRWAYTMETLSMISRVNDHLRHQKHQGKKLLLERSIYSGYHCFAQNSYAQGNLSELEWVIYNQWADLLLKESCLPPRGFIYLRAEPKVCYERIRKRGRESEKQLSLPYVQQIHDRHEKFLLSRDIPLGPIATTPVLVLDCNEPFEDNSARINDFLEKIQGFIEKTIR